MVDEIAAQRYMGYRAITILWSAALDHLLQTYAADASRFAYLEKLRKKDDKAFFFLIAQPSLITYFEDPVSQVM
jgi:hypothetical protein